METGRFLFIIDLSITALMLSETSVQKANIVMRYFIYTPTMETVLQSVDGV